MKKSFKIFAVLMLFCIVSCANMGATNTTATNVGVTAYETMGLALTQAYNIEKTMLKSGAITAKQDSDFQLGPYAKAVTCYKAMGTVAIAALTATDSASKATWQAKFDALDAQLPALIADVQKFIQEVK